MKYRLLAMILLTSAVSGVAQTAARQNASPPCAAFPCVVASISLANQTTAVSQTPIITATADGLFRVTYYLESSHIQGSTWGVAFSWTDDLKTESTGIFEAHAGSISAGTWISRVIAGQPITYAVTAGIRNPPGASYSLFITVEQLQ